MFALDAIEATTQLHDDAKKIARKSVEEIIGKDFGIYSGKKRKWAKLLFNASQAPWVKSETWHPEQRAETTSDGGYLLVVPYSDPRELLLEIMRFGPDVEVIEPLELRREVASRLTAAAHIYDRTNAK